MASPPIVTKGFAKWSLNSDDNANVDPLINWQEGQMPSTVNNSARAIMVRGREEHDLIQAQFKSILDTVSSKFGNKIKDVTADTYTIAATTTPNTWTMTFRFNDKLTLEEYNAYKAGNLYLLTTLNAPGIVNDSSYLQFSYNSIIYINLDFKIGSSVHSHIMMFKLNFFGIEKINQSISFHELKNFVNCSVLQEGGNNSTNLIAIPMTRTYMGTMKLPNAKLPNFYRNWYYVSPTECIVIDYDLIDAGQRFDGGNSFTLPGKAVQFYESNQFWGQVTAALSQDPSTKIFSVTYDTLSFWTHNDHILYGYMPMKFKYLITMQNKDITDYPMILTPTATNPYPIIV